MDLDPKTESESGNKTQKDDTSKPDDGSQFTSADRIRELLAIDSDVTKMLQTAGLAIQSLTQDPSVEDDEQPLEAAQREFGTKTNEFVVLAQSITARLRRQVYALEEAGIIAPDRATSESQQAKAMSSGPTRPNAPRFGAGSSQRAEPPMQITNGGLGNLDVSWLNSRSDRVGKQKEVELWSQARKHVESMLKDRNDSQDDIVQSMEVDDGDDR